MSAYTVLNVEYENQVVASKNSTANNVDTAVAPIDSSQAYGR